MNTGFSTNSMNKNANSYLIYETEGSSSNVVFAFDSIEESFFRATSNVTSYPTEQGINRTDYKYDNPSEITIKGLLRRVENRQNNGRNYDTVDGIMRNLKYYKSGIYPLNIQTKSGLYEKYTLKDYEIPEDYDNYGLLEVTMMFSQILTEGLTQNTRAENKDTVQAGIVQVKEINE